MGQSRLNHAMLLNIYKETGPLDLKSVLNKFVGGSEH